MLAFGSEMVFSGTCESKHCCQHIPGIKSKVTQMIMVHGQSYGWIYVWAGIWRITKALISLVILVHI